MRLAWFSPWPPDPSGIAGRSAELVPLLAARGHGIDVFVDEQRHRTTRLPGDPPTNGNIRVLGAHDFLWRARRGQYDLPVYQLGNSQLHQYIWPYVWQVPGLAMLHDARLHHARGRAWLSRRAHDGYRSEFAWNEPDVGAQAAELAIAGYGGTYYYLWPMIRAVVEGSRVVATHSPGAASDLRHRFPSRPIRHIPLGEGRVVPPSEEERAQTRRRLSIDPGTVLFGVFGGLTTEKRISQVLRAFAALTHRAAPAHLLLAGAPDPLVDLSSEIERLGIGSRVTVTGRIDDDEFEAMTAACDVSINLRWPSALEMSGPWLRALAAGRPTIVLDLAHLSDLPALDPRTWQLHVPPIPSLGARDAVAIAVDILDEEHSLILAMRRLAEDRDLRATLGRNGRAWWETHHTVQLMADEYARAIEEAARTAPPAPLPPPFRPDPLAHAQALASSFGQNQLL